MTQASYKTTAPPKVGIHGTPETEIESRPGGMGQAAKTGGDLAIDSGGMEPIGALSGPSNPEEKPRDNNPEQTTGTLDPICGNAVGEKDAPRLERDGKTFYFCSDRCLQQFLSTIEGVKPDSKAGNCCG